MGGALLEGKGLRQREIYYSHFSFMQHYIMHNDLYIGVYSLDLAVQQ
jgi:hypothetical protein